MANPYASPQVSPEQLADPEAFPDDPALQTLRFRKRVCTFSIGVVAVLIAAAMLLATYSSESLSGRLAAGVLLISAAFGGYAAFLGRSWTLYVAATVATLWLAFLIVTFPVVLAGQDFLPPETVVLAYVVHSLPGAFVLPIGAYGIALGRSIRRRCAALVRERELS